MIDVRETETRLVVRYRCLLMPLSLLIIPPGMLYEQGGGLLEGSLSGGETLGLLFGVFIPLLIVAYYVELAEFSFDQQDENLNWRWRNLFRQKNGSIPLSRVIKIRRDDLDASDLTGMQTRCRLQVVLDDGETIALTRGYSGLQGQRLNKIVDRVRDYLGHVTPMA